jgi:polygalacturonase
MKTLLFSFVCATLFSLTPLDGQTVYDIQTYGATGDGKTDDAQAIQKAINSCSEAGGGVVLIPAGQTFLTGPFDLKSNIELRVATGATLLANPDENVYTKSAFRDNQGEGTIWIGGDNVQNVTLTGSGTIDGNGISFMGKELDDSYELKPFKIKDPRPHLLTIVAGHHINIHNLVIRNSAYWTVHFVGCDDVTISDLTLLNSVKVRNSDGIDLDHTKNVRIANCYIESGDDCICLKNRREYQEYGSCERIAVTNCTMTSRSCAIKIGSENMDRISHVVFDNCIITNANRGLGIQNRDEGTVDDVLFSNIVVDCHLFSDVWWGKAEPIYVTAYRRANGNNKDANWRFPKGQTEGKVGSVKNIEFSNIRCTSENGIFVDGESAEKVTDIRFDQVDVDIGKRSGIEGGVYDRRPCNVEGIIKPGTSGFYLDQATRVGIINCSVRWGENKPDYFHYALETHGVVGLEVIQLSGGAAFPDKLKSTKED